MNIIFIIIRRAIVGTFILSILFGIIAAAYLESSLPSVEMLKDMRLQVPLRVYSSDGKLMAEFGEARRTPIRLNQVPPNLINAILATEDRRFYDHPGVDLRGLMRAAFHLLTNISVQQGGSTITMQVARNYFLTRKKTFIRKISEILLALKIEKEFSKDEILELYLNKIYFGKRAYGVAAAAEVYYGTTVEDLSLDQIAMIAGLPQAPSSINPLHNKEAAYKRRKHVLERMLSFEFITKEQYETAVNAPLPTRYHGRTIELDAPYVAEMVRQELYDRYGEAIYTLGYEVFTTIDSNYQIAANYALRRALLEYDQRHGFRRLKMYFKAARNKNPSEILEDWNDALQEVPAYGNLMPGVVIQAEGNALKVLLQDGRKIDIPGQGFNWTHLSIRRGNLAAGNTQTSADGSLSVGAVIYAYETLQHTWRMAQVPQVAGAFVSLQPDTGSILALVGGFDYNLSNFNRVQQAERQPGSNFKPFIYAAGLNEGYTLASVFNDAPFVYVDPVSGISWAPKNASGRFNGPMRLRVALKKSVNLVTVRLLQAVGVDNAIEFISRFGFDRARLPRFMSLALGVATVTPLEIAAGYSVFANGGNRVIPNVIKTIKDYQGNVVQEFTPPPATPAISPQIAYLITSALHDAIESGTGVRAKSLGRQDLSGKTGTTNDWHDAWFSGYNRDILATAWVGFDEPRSLREYGSVAALPMWIYFMEEVLKDKPEHAPPMPEGLVTVKIDAYSGRFARGGGVYEIFTEDTVPTTHQSGSYLMYGEEGNDDDRDRRSYRNDRYDDRYNDRYDDRDYDNGYSGESLF